MKEYEIMNYKLIVSIYLLSLNIYSKNIIIGQSAALSGPTQFLGREMKKGAMAYFNTTQNITLLTLDDKYEPDECIKNTKRMIENGVDVFFGYVGTPTSKACLPLINAAKKIFFGAFTGANFLSDQKSFPYSFSVRASYEMETENMVKYLVENNYKKIAIYIQDDNFGEVGKKGVLKALKKRNLKLAGEGRYKRNSSQYLAGAEKVLKSAADAVIIIGAYKPSSLAIKFWKSKNFDVPFLNISFVGSKELSKILKGHRKNVYVSQVVPSPWDSSIPIVREYQDSMQDNFGFVSLEGYIAAKIFHQAILQVGNNINNPDAFKSTIESIHTDIGGIKAAFGPKKHRAFNFTYLTKINSDGSFTYVKKLK